MKFTLPDLPYPQDAFEPRISAETFEYHHGRHHRQYVDSLNELVPGSAHADSSLEDIVRGSSGPLFEQAAQHFNHSFFWKSLRPGGSEPKAPLLPAIEAKWGSVAGLKDEFLRAANGLFGGGWVWLVKLADGSLAVRALPGAGCPLTANETPLAVVDIWEHAYYIDYRSARAEYLDAIWSLINWDFAGANFGK